MHGDYWVRQEADKPFFPDILWSRPENKRTAGKLLIIGGNAHGFATIGEAYARAVQAGAGTVRVLLPEVLRKPVGKFLENALFAPSNPSGGFSKLALAELLDASDWADAVLLAGEFGRNSETAAMLEEFVQKYKGELTITRDTIDYFFIRPELILARQDTLIVGATAQLQKLASASHFQEAISPMLDLVPMVEVLHTLGSKYAAHFITHHQGNTIVIAENRISTTKTGGGDDIWRIPTTAVASVFWLQNPGKVFEALTTSLTITTNS